MMFIVTHSYINPFPNTKCLQQTTLKTFWKQIWKTVTVLLLIRAEHFLVMKILLIMSNISFCNNVFKICQLQMRRTFLQVLIYNNAQTCNKLAECKNHIALCTVLAHELFLLSHLIETI